MDIKSLEELYKDLCREGFFENLCATCVHRYKDFCVAFSIFVKTRNLSTKPHQCAKYKPLPRKAGGLKQSSA